MPTLYWKNAAVDDAWENPLNWFTDAAATAAAANAPWVDGVDSTYLGYDLMLADGEAGAPSIGMSVGSGATGTCDIANITNNAFIYGGTFTGSGFTHSSTIIYGTFTGSGFTNNGSIYGGTFTGSGFTNNGSIDGGTFTGSGFTNNYRVYGGTFTGSGFTNNGSRIIYGGTFTCSGFTNNGTIIYGTFTGSGFTNNGLIDGGVWWLSGSMTFTSSGDPITVQASGDPNPYPANFRTELNIPSGTSDILGTGLL